jgi:hypothetical protein
LMALGSDLEDLAHKTKTVVESWRSTPDAVRKTLSKFDEQLTTLRDTFLIEDSDGKECETFLLPAQSLKVTFAIKADILKDREHMLRQVFDCLSDEYHIADGIERHDVFVGNMLDDMLEITLDISRRDRDLDEREKETLASMATQIKYNDGWQYLLPLISPKVDKDLREFIDAFEPNESYAFDAHLSAIPEEDEDNGS